MSIHNKWRVAPVAEASAGDAKHVVATAKTDFRVVRAATLVPVPWANNGGVTRVIADDPDWRLSLASIAQAGAFSVFPGFVRHFAVVSGQVELSGLAADGAAMLNAMTPPLVFAGDLPVFAAPRVGPVMALNLMIPTGAPPLQLVRCAGGQVTGARAVFACTAIRADDTWLKPHDTVFPDGPVHLSGPALVVR